MSDANNVLQELAESMNALFQVVNQQGVLSMTLLQYLISKGVVNQTEFQNLFNKNLSSCVDESGVLKVESLSVLLDQPVSSIIQKG